MIHLDHRSSFDKYVSLLLMAGTLSTNKAGEARGPTAEEPAQTTAPGEGHAPRSTEQEQQSEG